MRRRLIENAARGVGIRAGFSDEARRINAVMIQNWRAIMEREFNFEQLALRGGDVIPPVITRIIGSRELPSSRYLYSARASYPGLFIRVPDLVGGHGLDCGCGV